MNITILALGSRGDVQPGVALGVRLRRAGHSVRLGSFAQFADMAREHGLAFTPIAGDINAMLQSEEGRAMLRSRNPLKLLGVIGRSLRESAEQQRHDILAAAQEADGLVSLSAAYYAGETLAELRGIPHVTAVLQPLLATGEFPAPMLPEPPVSSPALNRLSHAVSEQLFWQIMRPTFNKVRRDLGLAPMPLAPAFSRAVRAGREALYAFSRLLVPRPADWPESAMITGFWFLDSDPAWEPPAALAEFLAAGDPPVYVGFGSMNTRDPRRTAELVLRALELSGRRGILLRGWGGMTADDLPPGAIMVDSAPHDWLLPRTAAVVHHGGSGTTGAALRAGVPSVVAPFFADQPFWAGRVAALGVGPEPIPQGALTAEGLARAIDWTGEPAARRRAAAVGAIVRAEDGVGRAAEVVARVFEDI
jgi:sterol 3beta-glucosyltransferase